LRPVRDQPGEDVDASGGTLGIGRARDAKGEVGDLEQWDDIDAAGFENRAARQIDLVHED